MTARVRTNSGPEFLERLRDEARCVRETPGNTWRPDPDLLEEAVELIEALQAESAKRTESLRITFESERAWREENAQLKAEVARLREGLSILASELHTTDDLCDLAVRLQEIRDGR